ncbi:MAG: polymerase sigma-70 factor, subfamily [Acidimicrobiaceae bacterium]
MAIQAEYFYEGQGADIDRDRLLVLRYQQGDEGAFDELYRRYYPRLHLYCMRRVRDRHIAEELAQEAFVRALRAMPQFAGERRFYPWMTVIAGRLCIDHHRRTSRVEPSADIDLGSVEPDHDAVFAAVDHHHLGQAMARVAPRHREVLDLREQQGWTYQEIAEHLDVPVTTVEALLHRARKALRREFMAVSSGTRLASLPVIGWVYLGLVRLRSKAAAARPEHVSHVAAPAIAGLVAIGVVLVPFIQSNPPGAPRTSAPAAVASAAASEPALYDPSAPAIVAAPPAAAPAAASTSAALAAPSEVAPDASVGGVDIFTTPEGQMQAKRQAEEMPIYTPLGPGFLGADPAQLVINAITPLIPAAPGANP